jgi:hypothetical protein
VYTTAWFNAQGNQACTGTAQATTLCSATQTGPASVTPGGTITAPPSGVTYTLYDTGGNRLYTTTGVYSPSGTYQYSRTSYQLYKNNSVTLNGTSISCTTQPPTQELPCATINPDDVVTQLKHQPGRPDLLIGPRR